jgi:tetratricopeptide (TPR) repeat protein
VAIAAALVTEPTSGSWDPRPLEGLAFSLLHRGDLERAAEVARAGWERAGRLGQPASEWSFRVLRAEVSRLQGRPEDALALLTAGDAPPGLPAATRVWLGMTRGYLRCLASRASRDAGRDELEQAEVEAVTAASPELRSEVALRLGTCVLEDNQLERAEAHFRRALGAAREAGSTRLETSATNNLGRVLMGRGRYDAAAASFEQAQALADAHGLAQAATRIAINRGWCHIRLGEYEKALAVLRPAAAIAARNGYASQEVIALQNVGNAHYFLRELSPATAAYLRAAEQARRLGDRKVLAQVLGNLAITSLEGHRITDAGVFNAEALALKEASGDLPGLAYARNTAARIAIAAGELGQAETILTTLVASGAAHPELAWEVHATLAGLYIRRGRSREAETQLARAVDTVERARAVLAGDEPRISFFSSLRHVYDDYIDFLVHAGRQAEALELSERARARILLERSRTPALGSRPASAGDLQRLSGQAGMVLVSLWTTQTRSLAWVIAGGRLTTVELAPPGELAARIDAYQRLVERAGDPLREGRPVADALAAAVVGRLRPAIPPGARVVVAADGPLQRLNLETAVVPGPEPHYWIEDVEISHAPSLSLLRACAPREVGPQRLLALGDPVAADPDFPRLPNAARELARIGGFFAPEQRSVYQGASARPGRYADARPGEFSLIHFAAHARSSRENPLDSAIVLSPGEESDKLYAREITGIPLRARVVTLSACRSAVARVYAGEGPLGLAWAFLRAGAENVVAGLWDVEDSSAGELMARLYEGLSRGAPPASALRAAKMALVKSETAHRKPYYWGPFVSYTQCPDTGRPPAD